MMIGFRSGKHGIVGNRAALGSPPDRCIRRDLVEDVEAPTTDLCGGDLYEVRLRMCRPRKQREVLRSEHLLHAGHLIGMALDHHAPCTSVLRFVAVDLECDVMEERSCGELGPRPCAEQQSVPIRHVVDREDVGLSGDVDGEPTDGGRIEQRPTFIRGQGFSARCDVRHAIDSTRVALARTGPNVPPPQLQGRVCNGARTNGSGAQPPGRG